MNTIDKIADERDKLKAKLRQANAKLREAKRELAAAKARIERLEEAGGRLFGQIGCGCETQGFPCLKCEVARNLWTSAKEAKP